jgi:molybdopterin converting factor small subunit
LEAVPTVENRNEIFRPRRFVELIPVQTMLNGWNMGSVQLKINPSIASMATATWFSTYLNIDYPLDGAATIGELLSNFTREHQEYASLFFDEMTGKISDRINVTLNRNMLVSSEADKVRIKDGDTILIMPIYEGG